MKDWLVMLFLGADDDLSPFGQNLLEEATRVGSSDRVTLVAELNPTVEAETLRGPIFRGRRELKKVGITNGSVNSIAGFVDDSNALYKAKHRALILWDHGNGWQNVHVFNKVLKPQEQLQLSAKDIAGEGLLVTDLPAVLDKERDIAVIGFDACLMAMIEIAFQFRGRAQFMVASQNLLPAERGWPYEALLRALTFNPRMDASELVTTMIDTFAGSYNGASDPVALSALRLSDEVESAVDALDKLSVALLAAIARSDARQTDVRGEIILARQHTQSFGNSDYIDIISFCEEIQKRLEKEREVCAAAELVQSAIVKLVVRQTRSGSPSIARANGVSIYFPQTYPGAEIVRSYAQLDFADADYCHWSTFLRVMVEGIDAPIAENAVPARSSAPVSIVGARQKHKRGAAAKHVKTHRRTA